MGASIFTRTPFQKPVNLLDSSISFISPGAVIDIHYHHAFQICTAINRPFDCQVGSHQLKDTWGFIVNRQVPHSCNAPDASVTVNFIDPDSYWGLALGKMLDGASFLDISSLLPRNAYRHLLREDYKTLPPEELAQDTMAFLDLLLKDHLQPIPPHKDERINAIQAYISEHIDRRITIKDLSRHIYLSPERTRHFFLEQTGIPVSQYILWKRIRGVAIAAVKEGKPLTDAAIYLGFTDYHHFRRVFRRMFGSAPNLVFSYCHMIL